MPSVIGTEFKTVGKSLWSGDWETIARSAGRKDDQSQNVYDIQDNIYIFIEIHVNSHLTMRKTAINNDSDLFQNLC